MATISVSAAFANDFNAYVQRTGMSKFEEAALRQAVREDFDRVGGWVTHTMAVYRFCFDTWGKLPTPELCRGYLASLRWFPEDDDVFKRQGILLLAAECMRVAEMQKE